MYRFTQKIFVASLFLVISFTYAKKKEVFITNSDTVSVSVLLRSAGCAQVVDGQTLVCQKVSVAPGQTLSLATNAIATGKCELVVFKGNDRYTTGMTLSEGDKKVWPQDFQMKTGGTVMLPGMSTYAKIKVRNDTDEPIRVFIKRTGCADIRTELGQTEGLLCAHDYVQPKQTEELSIREPFRNDFKVVVFQQTKDIRGIPIVVRYATDATYKHGDTVVWPTDFQEKAGFQQKSEDAFRKVGIIFKGIGLAVGGLKALVSTLKQAATKIQDMQGDLKNNKPVGDKAVVIAKMIDELVPALGIISETIDNIGKYLIEPFDKDAYQKSEEAAKITASIRDLVVVINKTIMDLAPTLTSIESGIKEINTAVKTGR